MKAKNMKPIFASAVIAWAIMGSPATAQEAGDLVENRKQMISLNQELERLKAQIDVERAREELTMIQRERQARESRARRPMIQPDQGVTITPEMVQQQIEAATRELEEQRERNRPRDSSLDGAFIQEAYKPRGSESMQAILNARGNLIKVQEGSEIGDWKVVSITLGRVEAVNQRREERIILGDGTSAV